MGTDYILFFIFTNSKVPSESQKYDIKRSRDSKENFMSGYDEMADVLNRQTESDKWYYLDINNTETVKEFVRSLIEKKCVTLKEFEEMLARFDPIEYFGKIVSIECGDVMRGNYDISVEEIQWYLICTFIKELRQTKTDRMYFDVIYC